jgi:hypothetical protein
LADKVRIATAKEETRSKSNPSSTLTDEIQPLACLGSEIKRVREKRGPLMSPPVDMGPTGFLIRTITGSGP